jgi:nucleoside-diphosphate-sugar epimerase
MRIGVTGAGGFVGEALVARLAEIHRNAARIVAIDATLPSRLPDGVERAEGDICDPGFLGEICARPFDIFFHLAAVPGGVAERDNALARRVNVEASTALLDRLAAQPKPARLVFASSIGVFGTPLPKTAVDDATLPLPTMSYGAQKLIGEILVSDFARRGLVDGLAPRLPGILARPRSKGGHLSAYMSDILHALRAGETFVCPVAENATSWFMSRATCVDNLLHAAQLPRENLTQRRAFNLPALHLAMHDLVNAAAVHFGDRVHQLVTYEPNAALQAQFGSYPPLLTPIADGLGFRHDGDATSLVANALELHTAPGAQERGAA